MSDSKINFGQTDTEAQSRSAISAGEAHKNAIEQTFEGANPTTEAKNTLVDKPTAGEQANNKIGDPNDVPPGQTKAPAPGAADQNRTVAAGSGDPQRVGPGTGDGIDTRPLGDPTAPQGTGREVPGMAIPPAPERPAPAGEIRVSHAESGDYSK